MTSEITSNLLNQAKEYLISGDYDQAIKAAKGVIALDPTNTEAEEILTASQAASGGNESVAESETNPVLDALSDRLRLARTNRDLFLVESDIKKFLNTNKGDASATDLLEKVLETRNELSSATAEQASAITTPKPQQNSPPTDSEPEVKIYEGSVSFTDVLAAQGLGSILIYVVFMLAMLWAASVFSGYLLWIPILVSAYFILVMIGLQKNFHVKITNQIIELETGIFSKDFETIELYRAKDTGVRQGFLQAQVNSGVLTVVSDDATLPVTAFIVQNPRAIQAKLRQAIREQRLAMGTTARI